MITDQPTITVCRLASIAMLFVGLCHCSDAFAQSGRESLSERRQRSANPSTQKIRDEFGYHAPADDSVIKEATGYGPTGPLTPQQQGYLDANKRALQGPAAISPESESPRSGTMRITGEEAAEVERMMGRGTGSRSVDESYSSPRRDSSSFSLGEPWQLAVGGLAVAAMAVVVFWKVVLNRKIPDGCYSAGVDGKLIRTPISESSDRDRFGA